MVPSATRQEILDMRNICHLQLRRPQQLWALSALVMVAPLLAGCSNQKSKSNEDRGPRGVYALGRLEPAGGIVSISAIPGERIQDLDADVKENSLVPANGILGVLASYELGKEQLEALYTKKNLTSRKREQEEQAIKAQLAQAEAAKAEAEAKQAALPLEEEKLELLKEASELAQAEHQRLFELSMVDPALVEPHQLAKKENEMHLAMQEQKIAAERVASAKKAVAKAVAAADENVNLAKLAERQSSEGFEVDAIRAEIAVAEAMLRRSVLLSPHVSAQDVDVRNITCKADHEGEETPAASAGRPYTILKVLLQKGETVTQSPIIQMGDLREMVCIAEVYEADAKHISRGQGVTIRSPSFSDDFADGEKKDPETARRSGGIRGEVLSKSQMVAPPGVENRNPLAPVDRKVVEVRISITDPAALAHARSFVGLEVTVEFDATARDQKPGDSE